MPENPNSTHFSRPMSFILLNIFPYVNFFHYKMPVHILSPCHYLDTCCKTFKKGGRDSLSNSHFTNEAWFKENYMNIQRPCKSW